MPNNYTIKLEGSELSIYTSAVIAYKNLMLNQGKFDAIPSKLLEKAQDRKIKLSELEYKHLLKATQMYRNNLIKNKHDTTSASKLLRKILDVKAIDKGR